MNICTIKLAFSGLAATLALVVPGISWAGDHYLGLVNVTNKFVGTCTSAIPTTVLADKAIVSGGSLTHDLTLRNLCTGSGTNQTDVTFSGSLTPYPPRQVKMCKRWTTKDGGTAYGWLDQGMTNIGVTGTLTGISPNGNYRVVLTMGSPVTVNTDCTVNNQGAYDYTVTRTAEVFRDDAPTPVSLATADFTFGNTAPQGSAPEPGTLSLIGLGLAGLWLGARRARKIRADVV